MDDLNAVKQLNIMDKIFGMNIPHHTPKPKTSRWNRKYTEVADWHVAFHTISYPLQQGHYFQYTSQMIEVPQLVMRMPN